MKYQGFFLMLFYFFNVWNVYLDHPLCFLNSFKPKLMVQNKRLFMDTYFPTVGICCSDAKSCPTLLWPHGLQHAKLPFPSLSPGACSNSCPLNRWCHPTISSSVAPFSSCPQSFQNQGLSQWVGSLHFLLWLSSNSLALIFLLVPFRQVLYTFILFSDLRSLFYCFDSLL